MIKVYLNRLNFQYEVHSLIRAFCPNQEVQVDCSEKEKNSKQKEADAKSAVFVLEIRFSALEDGLSQILLLLTDREDRVLSRTACCREKSGSETKNELKRNLYQLLHAYTGKDLPWGTLTGIRPVKIPMKMLREGRDDEAISSYMKDNYYTSDEKTALAVRIAKREIKVLDRLSLGGGNKDKDTDVFTNGYSLYIGIPFCPSICLYCSFSSSPIDEWRDQVDNYLDKLLYEMESVRALLPDQSPDTVYIGGGTPTTLSCDQLDRLLCKLEDCFPLGDVKELTVEAGRPDTITREKLAVLCAHNISRISVNPQTMNQKTLDFIGRKHSVEQTEQAFYLSREMGFDNINMDLIVGLPGEGLPEVEHSMQALARLDPDNITVHSLAVKRAARLRLFKEEHEELSFENSSEIMNMTARYAAKSGLTPYYLYRQKNMAGNFENVGYAREGMEGLYNILIMEEVQSIIGLGAGASTKLVHADNRIERVENVKDIRNYLDRTDEMIERKRQGIYGIKEEKA